MAWNKRPKIGIKGLNLSCVTISLRKLIPIVVFL
jgi:hypothetical protein